MTRVTTSFTIEADQLARVDELAVELDRDRSSTLRQLIDAGLPVLRAARQVSQALQRGPLPAGAFPGAYPEEMEVK